MLVGSTAALTAIEPQGDVGAVKKFKTCECVEQGVAVAPGMRVWVAQRDRPVLHAYDVRREGVSKRIVVPAKLVSLEASPDGKLLAGGAVNGSIYLWNADSGELLSMVTEAHFQAATHLAFNADSTILASGGADARVLVWRLLDLLSPNPEPVLVCSNHTLGLTGLVFSFGSFNECRLYTSSLDASVCCWDVWHKRQLYTVVADGPIKALAVDAAERALYLGVSDSLVRVMLYAGTDSIAPIASLGGVVAATNRQSSVKCGGEVTALSLNTDCALIYVGNEAGVVATYETGTLALNKKFRTVQGAVTQLVHEKRGKERAFVALQHNVGDVNYILETEGPKFSPAWDLESELSEIDRLSFAGTSASTGGDAGGAGSAGAESSAANNEVAELKQRLQKLQEMYDALWAKRVSSAAN